MASVIYGMTQNLYRHSENYIPMDDGWRRLRDGRMPEQDMIAFDVPDNLMVGLSAATVAEMLFVATNAPDEAIDAYGRLARWFADTLTGDDNWRWVGAWIDGREPRALSVGDTVTVEGEDSLGCSKHGWKPIS